MAKEYKFRGDTVLKDDYFTAFDRVAELSTKGNNIRNNIQQLDTEIDRGNADFSKADQEVLDLTRKLETAKSNRTAIEKKNTELRDKRNDSLHEQDRIKEEFKSVKGERDKAKKAYFGSIPSYDSDKTNSLLQVSGPSPGRIDLFALGDIHGWAPGLSNFLVSNKLADIKVNEIPMGTNATEIYPDVDLLTVKGRAIEGQWLDGSTFTPITQHAEDGYRGAFGKIDVQPGEALNHGFFLQVGDLNDRGDYTEVVFEIMRKLCLSSGGRAFSLMGNHELFLLTGEFNTWLHNERESGMFRSKNQPGSIRLLKEYLGHKSTNDDDAFEKSIFFSYCAHFAHHLLTQEYVMRAMLEGDSRTRYVKDTQPALDLYGITDKKLEEIAHDDTWETVDFCYEWLTKIMLHNTPLKIPGAFVCLSIGHVLGLHASIASLGKFFDDEKRSASFLKPYRTKQGAMVHLHLMTHAHKQKSPDYELMWQRDHSTWGSKTQPSKKMSEALAMVQEKMPHISSIVQGHEVLGGRESSTKTHTVETKIGPVDLTNLDTGMTPVYLHHKIEDKYDLARTPEGIRIATFGHTPHRLGTSFKLSPNLKLDVKFEHPNRTNYVDVRHERSGTTLARFEELESGDYILKSRGKDVVLGVRGETTKPTKEIRFKTDSPLALRLYKEQRGFFRTLFEPVGEILIGSMKSQSLEEDEVVMNAKAEEERLKKEEAERQAEQERLRKEEAERKAEQERLRKEEAERKAEQERLRKEEVERKAEQERLRKEEDARKAEQGRLKPEGAPLEEKEEKQRKETVDPTASENLPNNEGTREIEQKEQPMDEGEEPTIVDERIVETDLGKPTNEEVLDENHEQKESERERAKQDAFNSLDESSNEAPPQLTPLPENEIHVFVGKVPKRNIYDVHQSLKSIEHAVTHYHLNFPRPTISRYPTSSTFYEVSGKFDELVLSNCNNPDVILILDKQSQKSISNGSAFKAFVIDFKVLEVKKDFKGRFDDFYKRYKERVK